MSEGQFPGIYKGTVDVNVDPEQRGRLILKVPAVFGPLVPSTWAEPCAPLAGPTATPMGAYFIPPINASVWVAFENGDPDRPVWLGCRFESTGEVPANAKLGNPADPNIIIQSLLQHSIMISDMPPTPATGGIVIQSTTGAKIVVNDSGIYIDNGKGASIKLVASAITMQGTPVDINSTALVVN